MTRLSCHQFRGNEVRLWPGILAYNLGNLWRRLALPGGIEDWSLTSVQQRLVSCARNVWHRRWKTRQSVSEDPIGQQLAVRGRGWHRQFRSLSDR